MSSNQQPNEPATSDHGSTFTPAALFAIMVGVGGVALHAFGIFGVRVVEHEQPVVVNTGAFIGWSGDFTLSDALLLDPEPLYLPSSLNTASVYRPAAINTSSVPLFADFEPLIQLDANKVAPEDMDAGFAWDTEAMLAGSHWPAFQGAANAALSDAPKQTLPKNKLKIRIENLNGSQPVLDVLAVEELPENFEQLWQPVELQATISSDGQLLEPLLLGSSGYDSLDRYIIGTIMQAESLRALGSATYRITVSP